MNVKINMKMKAPFILFSLFVILTVVFSCATFISPLKVSYENHSTTLSLDICCEECLAQAERDPSGYDISIKPCAQYELSKGCEKYFENKNLLVGECSAVKV